jgi:tetratricopeptide (TPR) repeat protein
MYTTKEEKVSLFLWRIYVVVKQEKASSSGTILRQFREERGWSLQETVNQISSLYEKEKTCPLNVSMVGKWERSEHIPSPTYRKLFCQLYQRTASELGFIPTVPPVVSQQDQIEGTKAMTKHPNMQDTTSLDSTWTSTLQAFSRRSMLTSLAALPLACLYPLVQQNKHEPFPEELLPACATSITSCWYLLNGSDLAVIEKNLPAYLPTLVSWAQKSSRSQPLAAGLAAQGSLLMGLLAYHRLRFPALLTYTNQAVELARLSGDLNLQTYALVLSGMAYKRNDQPKMMLQRQQEAAQHLSEVLPSLQSYVCAELAEAYAQNGMPQEALATIGKAHTLYPGTSDNLPGYLSADYDPSKLSLIEGLLYLKLGENDPDHAKIYAEQASRTLGQIETRSPEIPLSRRLEIEITNYQAQAAIETGKLDEAEYYMRSGILGAAALKSEKRRQEALDNWQAARKRWPQERSVLSLTDLIHFSM